MTVILSRFRMAYFAVPKVACTTIKTKLFQIENNTDIEELIVNGREFSIHRLYPTREFSEINQGEIAGFFRVAMVRDPVARFLSTYRNRVLEKNEIADSRQAASLTTKGLPLKPDLSTFIAHIEDYKVVRGISHHVSPLTTFLGKDSSYFSRIFDIRESEKFFEMVGNITGREIRPARHNASSIGEGVFATPAEEERLRRFYEEDYRIYGHFMR